MKTNLTISNKEKLELVNGVAVLSAFDKIILPRSTWEKIIENVLIQLEIEEEKEDK